MLTFPPAHLPIDPSDQFEPYEIEEKVVEDKRVEPIRADYMMYQAGLEAMKGKLLITDDGRLLEVIDARPEDVGSTKWFLWDGQTRRVYEATWGEGKTLLTEMLSEAFPFAHGRGDDLYDEAQMRLKKALAYDPKKDIDLIIDNFDLLIDNTDRILSTPYLNNGAIGGLRTAFIYAGQRRFPISALLGAWRAGKWKVKCPNSKEHSHEAFVLVAGGGFSIGDMDLYCPTCKMRMHQRTSGGGWFASILPFISQKGSNGYRLDEIVEELRK